MQPGRKVRVQESVILKDCRDTGERCREGTSPNRGHIRVAKNQLSPGSYSGKVMHHLWTPTISVWSFSFFL